MSSLAMPTNAGAWPAEIRGEIRPNSFPDIQPIDSDGGRPVQLEPETPAHASPEPASQRKSACVAVWPGE